MAIRAWRAELYKQPVPAGLERDVKAGRRYGRMLEFDAAETGVAAEHRLPLVVAEDSLAVHPRRETPTVIGNDPRRTAARRVKIRMRIGELVLLKADDWGEVEPGHFRRAEHVGIVRSNLGELPFTVGLLLA